MKRVNKFIWNFFSEKFMGFIGRCTFRNELKSFSHPFAVSIYR